jgi:hypothetical protein
MLLHKPHRRVPGIIAGPQLNPLNSAGVDIDIHIEHNLLLILGHIGRQRGGHFDGSPILKVLTDLLLLLIGIPDPIHKLIHVFGVDGLRVDFVFGDVGGEAVGGLLGRRCVEGLAGVLRLLVEGLAALLGGVAHTVSVLFVLELVVAGNGLEGCLGQGFPLFLLSLARDLELLQAFGYYQIISMRHTLGAENHTLFDCLL